MAETMENGTGTGTEKKVMVAIDESECSHYALVWILDNLKDSITKSPLIIFTAQPPATGNITFAAPLGVARITKGVSQKIVLVVNTAPGYVESAQENHRKFAVALLEKAKQICASRGVNATLVTEIGDPKSAICDAVERHNIGLLILGERGLGTIKRAILGSVSDYCVQNAKCPVLVVKKSQVLVA